MVTTKAMIHVYYVTKTVELVMALDSRNVSTVQIKLLPLTRVSVLKQVAKSSTLRTLSMVNAQNVNKIVQHAHPNKNAKCVMTDFY